MIRRGNGTVTVGERIAEHGLVSISGEPVSIPDPEHLIHVQFRRYAGCPFCNLHLRSVAARYDEIQAHGVREVVLFHSTAEGLLAYNDPTPFAVVADPDKRLYREFGVEPSLRSLLNPRAWAPMIRGVATKKRPLAGDHRSGHLGLPADFLIASDGHVLARKYGEHAFDQWSVDELLSLSAKETP
jgi:peroxiredoxin